MGLTEEQQFFKELLKLDPISFIGIAKILGVKLDDMAASKEEAEAEETNKGQEILIRVFEAFTKLSHRKKKEILKLVKQVNKEAKQEEKENRKKKKSKDVGCGQAIGDGNK